MIEKFNDILIEICTRGSIYDEIIDNILGSNSELKAELISELTISFANNKRKIVQIYNEGYFKYYFIRAVKNQIQSNTSSFHKNCRQTISEKLADKMDDIQHYQDNNITDINELREIEHQLKQIEKAKSELIRLSATTWFESEMARLYYDEGYSFRGIEKEYGIDHVWAWETINGYKQKLIEELKKPKYKDIGKNS